MDTQNLQSAEQTAIKASVVHDELRIGFWPHHFGSIPQWITLEPQIFAWMDRLCTDYHGGIWNFSTLSNGGAFMAPEAEINEKWTLFNSMNGNHVQVHPREIVKSALRFNAAAVVLAHNHPSGHPEPSQCDRNITGRIKEPLALVDVNTLDHLVVGTDGIVSFAERGWI